MADLTPKEIEKRAAKKAKLAQVLERGIVISRLETPVEELKKDGMVGCWVRENDDDINRYQALGFELETGMGAGKDTGDNRQRVGDSVLMSTSQENWDIIQEINTERRKKRSVKKAKAEYVRQARANPDIPIIGDVDEGVLSSDFDVSIDPETGENVANQEVM
jgi:hypothetical protein